MVLGEWGTSLVGDDAKWAEELATYLKAKVHLVITTRSHYSHARSCTPLPHACHVLVTLLPVLNHHPPARTNESPSCTLLQNLTSTFFWALNPAGEEGSGLIKVIMP